MSIRSLMPGIARRSSLVRIGRSPRSQRIVPFHRPRITLRAVSTGQCSIVSGGRTGEAVMASTLVLTPK